MLPCVLDLTMLYITSNRTVVTSDPTYISQCEKNLGVLRLQLSVISLEVQKHGSEDPKYFPILSISCWLV